MGDIIDNPPQNTFDDFREVCSAKNLEEKKLVYLDFGVYQVYENDDVFHRVLENYTENCQFVYSPAHIEEVCRMNSQNYEEKRCESISNLCNNIEALPVDECIKVVFEPIAECLKRARRLIKLNEIAEKNDCAKFEALDDEMCQILNCDKTTLIRNRETLSEFTLSDFIADKSNVITTKDINRIFFAISLSNNPIEYYKGYFNQERAFSEIREAVRILYLLMNALGIHRNKIEKSTNFNYKALYPSYDRKFYRTIRSGFYDVEHLSYASITDYFITCDNNLSYQANEIYTYLGAKAKVIYCDKEKPELSLEILHKKQ